VTSRAAAWLVAAVAALGCATPKADPRYQPTQSILEAVAVLRRHVPDDTYRFPPARDFTGRNVYRASLLRLENLERVHQDALRAGHMDDVIDFAKARALERLRAYDLAASHYRRAAEHDGPLRSEALRSAALCDRLAEATRLAAVPLADAKPQPRAVAAATGPALDFDAAMRRFDQRRARLEALLEDVKGSHYESVVREELERADMARADYVVDTRRLQPDGDVRALAALQRLVMDHRESKNANAHLLALADLYAQLALEYVERHPPEALSFDPPHFEELVESASRLYQAVSNQDGAPEKLEAARRLEAFLAFTLKVDRDRFAQ